MFENQKFHVSSEDQNLEVFGEQQLQYDCVSTPVTSRPHLRHEIYCALCGTKRNIWVSSSKLTPMQHIQTVLFSIFLAWALFPVLEAGAFFLYPFVWLGADLAKKVLYRRGAQCRHCGFDAITYRKDVRKAKLLVKNHMDSLGRPVIFKNGYKRKPKDQDGGSDFLNF